MASYDKVRKEVNSFNNNSPCWSGSHPILVYIRTSFPPPSVLKKPDFSYYCSHLVPPPLLVWLLPSVNLGYLTELFFRHKLLHKVTWSEPGYLAQWLGHHSENSPPSLVEAVAPQLVSQCLITLSHVGHLWSLSTRHHCVRNATINLVSWLIVRSTGAGKVATKAILPGCWRRGATYSVTEGGSKQLCWQPFRQEEGYLLRSVQQHPLGGVRIDRTVESTEIGAGTLGGAEDALRTVSERSGLLNLRNPLAEASGLAACARGNFQRRQNVLPVTGT